MVLYCISRQQHCTAGQALPRTCSSMVPTAHAHITHLQCLEACLVQHILHHICDHTFSLLLCRRKVQLWLGIIVVSYTLSCLNVHLTGTTVCSHTHLFRQCLMTQSLAGYLQGQLCVPCSTAGKHQH